MWKYQRYNYLLTLNSLKAQCDSVYLFYSCHLSMDMALNQHTRNKAPFATTRRFRHSHTRNVVVCWARADCSMWQATRRCIDAAQLILRIHPKWAPHRASSLVGTMRRTFCNCASSGVCHTRNVVVCWARADCSMWPIIDTIVHA